MILKIFTNIAEDSNYLQLSKIRLGETSSLVPLGVISNMVCKFVLGTRKASLDKFPPQEEENHSNGLVLCTRILKVQGHDKYLPNNVIVPF